MQDLIAQHLSLFAERHGVRVLLAVESGSRAWGCPSPDSDYDVRVVFAYPEAQYTSVYPPAEQREYFAEGGDLDFKGWDLRKALQLLAGGNATLGEWSQSPVVYAEEDGFRQNLLAMTRQYARPLKLLHHYAGLAKGRIAECAPGQDIKVKRLCYALRSGLAARWVMREEGLPPMTFADLLAQPGLETLRPKIEDLLLRKADLAEDFAEPLDESFFDFVTATIAEARGHSFAERRPPQSHEQAANTDALDRFFREQIRAT